MNISSILSNNTKKILPDQMQLASKNAYKFFKDYTFDTAPEISEKSLRDILKLSISLMAQLEEKEKNSNPWNQDSSFYFLGRWHYHMLNLEELEIRFRNSHEYTSEKAIEIFHIHFEELKKYVFKEPFSANLKLFSHTVGEEYYLTPIGYAYSRKLPALIHALIKSGANRDCGFISTMKNVPLYLREISPLSLMYYTPHKEHSFYTPFQLHKLKELCTKILLDHEANPNAFVLGEETGTTVLNMSVFKNDHEMITLLVSSKAEINPSQQSVINPLKVAVTKSPSLDTVKTLIQLGADIFSLDSETRTFEDFSLTHSKVIENSSKEGAATSIKISEYLKDAKIRIIKRSETTLLDLHIPQVLIDIIINYLWV